MAEAERINPFEKIIEVGWNTGLTLEVRVIVPFETTSGEFTNPRISNFLVRPRFPFETQEYADTDDIAAVLLLNEALVPHPVRTINQKTKDLMLVACTTKLLEEPTELAEEIFDFYNEAPSGGSVVEWRETKFWELSGLAYIFAWTNYQLYVLHTLGVNTVFGVGHLDIAQNIYSEWVSSRVAQIMGQAAELAPQIEEVLPFPSGGIRYSIRKTFTLVSGVPPQSRQGGDFTWYANIKNIKKAAKVSLTPKLVLETFCAAGTDEELEYIAKLSSKNKTIKTFSGKFHTAPENTYLYWTLQKDVQRQWTLTVSESSPL